MEQGPTRASQRGCPLCGEMRGECLHTQRFVLPEGHPLAAGYDVACCARCRFVFADVAATQDDYDRFYAQHSKYEDAATAPSASPESLARFQDRAALLARLIPSKAARILDVGCAGGDFLLALHGQGFANLVGIDPSPVCVTATRRHGLQAETGTFSALPAQLGKFDAIVLSHVLEHVHDVQGALRSLAGLLAPDGRLFIEVPDGGRYDEYYVTPFHYFDTEHINHFSPAALARAVAGIGFQVEQQARCEAPLTPEVTYPAVWIWAGRGQPAVNAPIPDLRDSMLRYIEKSNADFDLAPVRRLAESRRPVIVWGVGCSTTRLLAHSDLARADIVCFTDNNPKAWTQRLLGRDVIPPSKLVDRTEPIVITSRLYGAEIAAQIRDQLQLPNEIIELYRRA